MAGATLPKPQPLSIGCAMFEMTLHTSHFTFTAYGATLLEVHEVMKGVLQKHADDYELAPDWYLPYWDDADHKIVLTGWGFRDGEKVYER